MEIFSLVGRILLKDDNTKDKLQEIDSSASKLGSTFDSSFERIKNGALKVGAVLGVGLGVKSLIQEGYKFAESASDMSEAQNVVEQTFKNSSKSIEQWTTTTAKSAGISQTASTQWVGFMGAMLKSSGVSEQAAGGMSEKLVQLTGDMSSFYNIGTSDMWEKVRSGISGETEPLKQLGINMSVTNLQAFALSEGITKPYDKMSQSEQTILRYNYLMSVTKDAQGDFGRTLSTSFANQVRVAQLNFKTLQQSIGTMLLPAFNSAVIWFNTHMPQIQSAISNMVNGAGSGIKLLEPIVKSGLGSFKEVMNWIVEHSELTKAAIVGIGTAFATLKTINAATKAITDFRNGMNLVAGATGTISRLGVAFMELRTAPTILIGLKGAFTAIFGFNPIILALVAGVAALAAGAYLLVIHWTQVKTFFTGLWTYIKTVFAGIKTSIEGTWNSVKTSTVNVWNSIKSSIVAIWNSLKTNVATVFNGIKTTIVTIWNGIKTAIMVVITPIVQSVINLFNNMKTGIFNIFNGFQTYFTGIWQAIKTIFLGAILLIIDLVTGNFTKLSQDAQLIWNDLKTAFSNIWNGIKEIFTGTLQAIAAFLSTEWENIKTVVTIVWNGIKTFLSDLWNSLKDIASTAWNAMKEAISSIVTGTIETVKSIWNGIINFFKSLPSNLETLGRNMFNAMKNGISSVLSTLESVVSNGFNGAINFIKKLPSEALQWGKDFIDGLVNGISGNIGKVENAVEGVANKVRSFLHFSRPDEGPLHDYETWMPDFLQGLANGINSNKGIITKAMQGLTNSMSLGSGNNNQAQYGQNLNESLGEGIQDSQDKVTKPVDNLSNTITTKITTLVQSFIQHGQNSDTNLGNGITTNSDATLTPLNTLITTITTGIKTFVQSCIGHGQDTDKNLGNGITNSSGEVINAANTVTTTVGNNLDTFAKGSIKYGQDTDNSIASGVTGTVNTVTSAANGLTTAIGNILKTFASSCVSIGQSIGNSIASGMQASEDNAVSIAHELTQKIINAFTGPDGFDIHSPSRRLFEIGSYVIQGFINGLSSQDVLKFFQNKIGSMLSVAGDVSKWLSMALMITGTPMDWLPGLLKLASYESGDPGTLGSGDPTLVNSVGVGGEYATGLLQMLPSTFSENMLGGFNNIMNPIDNAIAAIRYIKNRYGSVYNTPLFTSGGAYQGYEKGTDNATEGPHPVAENGLEIVLGKALRWFSGGETVLNDSDSMALLDNIKNAVETVRSLGSMSFGSFPVIKTKETKTTEDKNTKVEKHPIILKLILQNGKELAEYLIDDINKLQGEIQLSKNRVALGRR